MGSIEITTKIPGPRSVELARRGLAAIASPLVPGGEVFVADALGAVMEDVDGNRYLDFIGGVGCVVTGHNHPRVVDAVHGQVDAFIHTDFSILPYEPYVQLAERLSGLLGGNRKCGFFNSGAEAVENAIKIARGVTGRPGIVCFEGAFHGRTLMGMSLTHREVPYKAGFGPFASEIYRAPYAGFDGSTLVEAIPHVERLFEEHSIAAVIIEPILGEGGFVPAQEGFLQALSRVCAENGAALIADEIQTGYGRTGSFIASDLVGVRPDIITLGKSIASGLPLSAVVGSPEWMDVLERNTLGGTYVGNPVACAAALAVLDVIEDEGLIERAKLIGERLRSGWEQLAKQFPVIAEIRGVGSMIGVRFAEGSVVTQVITQARARGVLAMSAGSEGDVIRHLMPLVMDDDQLDEAFEVFSACLRTLG